jgi:molybdopterin-containing oxidoreductase family iron-sulfur binding subunit
VEACPTAAIRFGNLADPNDPVSQEAHSPNAFRFLARLGTEPKLYYKSKEAWVRALAESASGSGVKQGEAKSAGVKRVETQQAEVQHG